jgi:F-type H+-transporting ATPase subunit a
MAAPHISLAAEKIGSVFGLPITNSIVMTWFTMAILIIFSLAATSHIKAVPGNLQSVAELIVDGLYNLFKSVVGEHFVLKFFSLLTTIFLFIVIANWGGLLPGVGTIGFWKTEELPQAHEESIVQEEVKINDQEDISLSDEHAAAETEVSIQEENAVTGETAIPESAHETEFVPLLRGATADLNTTLAIAIIAVFSIQFYGVRSLGIGYFKKFLNFSDPIMFGVGLLEIVSEFSRIVSFAFRLFGNIFAGEVLLTVIAFLMPLFAPLPFLGLELFVGFIQALVFSMLTAVFLNMATVSHEH